MDELLHKGDYKTRRRERSQPECEGQMQTSRGMSKQKIEEIKSALRELGLDDNFEE